jgi:hypothetical protein
MRLRSRSSVERVNDRIHDRRTGADSACFAGSLKAERIVPARDVARLKLDGGHLVGPRYRIIHQARGHELNQDHRLRAP